MPEKQRIPLDFPSGGRSDRFAFQKQPPYTTVSALNVWPYAIGRTRGGSRPGTERFWDLGGTIYGLGQVSYIPTASDRIKTSIVAMVTDALYMYDYEANFLYGPHNYSGSATGEIISMAERNQKVYIAHHSIDQAASAAANAPLIYDPLTDAISSWTATSGTLPKGCPCICLWRDRMVLAGGTTTPYGIFFSRQGDPLDWDYSVTDVGGAVVLGNANAGQIGDTVTSLTPHADNCLIIGCPTSLWMLQGDPRLGGQLANLSQTIGVVDRNAWCTTPDGLFVFLSADGLYMIPAGCSTTSNPVSISREKLPEELLNVDRRSVAGGKVVSMEYDVRHRGIHIFLSARATGDSDEGDLHWFVDWETKSFWPVQFGAGGFDPWGAIARHNYTSDESTVIFACRDGVLRRYTTENSVDDEGEADDYAIDSHVAIGPIGDEDSDVRIDELGITLDNDSERVTWELYAGPSAQTVKDSLADSRSRIAGRIDAGRNPRINPRISGAYLLLKLSSKAKWALDSAYAIVSRLGRTRV